MRLLPDGRNALNNGLDCLTNVTLADKDDGHTATLVETPHL